jgi:CopG family nickel-responsive transcriptional regulator
MSELVRFGVSLEKTLLDRFDALIRGRGYTNRSEALRDLIRQELVRLAWEKGQEVAGAIILNYDHHQRDMLAKITDIQHDHQDIILSTQHIHLDHHACLEIVAVRGRAEAVEGLAHALRSVKGVKHGTLSMSGTGREMG